MGVTVLLGAIRVSLSLVDLNTAIVIHTRTAEFAGSRDDISQFTQTFASDTTQLLTGANTLQ
jgi:hypothetical protein